MADEPPFEGTNPHVPVEREKAVRATNSLVPINCRWVPHFVCFHLCLPQLLQNLIHWWWSCPFKFHLNQQGSSSSSVNHIACNYSTSSFYFDQDQHTYMNLKIILNSNDQDELKIFWDYGCFLSIIYNKNRVKAANFDAKSCPNLEFANRSFSFCLLQILPRHYLGFFSLQPSLDFKLVETSFTKSLSTLCTNPGNDNIFIYTKAGLDSVVMDKIISSFIIQIRKMWHLRPRQGRLRSNWFYKSSDTSNLLDRQIKISI